MKQLQNGIYTFNIGERSWGEEVNQNFEALDNLISGVAGNNDKIELLSEKIQTNTDNFEQTKDDLIDNINNTKNGLQDQIDILNNNILTLKYKIDNMDISVDSVKYAEEADVAKKLKKSLTIGNVSFNGEADMVVTIDGTPMQNSSNLINSNAVYDALELKQDKATTLSGYGITDAYTKTQIDNKISTIPTVNNATLTIQKNGTTVKTFTANSSTNVTCNITVPTKVSDLTNDSGFIADVSGKADKATTLNGYNITDAYTKSEIDTKLDEKSNTNHTHSNYLTGITKAMVTDALGYTPPTQDTNTTYTAGSNLSLNDTTFNVSDTPSFTSITISGFSITID